MCRPSPGTAPFRSSSRPFGIQSPKLTVRSPVDKYRVCPAPMGMIDGRPSLFSSAARTERPSVETAVGRNSRAYTPPETDGRRAVRRSDEDTGSLPGTRAGLVEHGHGAVRGDVTEEGPIEAREIDRACLTLRSGGRLHAHPRLRRGDEGIAVLSHVVDQREPRGRIEMAYAAVQRDCRDAADSLAIAGDPDLSTVRTPHDPHHGTKLGRQGPRLLSWPNDANHSAVASGVRMIQERDLLAVLGVAQVADPRGRLVDHRAEGSFELKGAPHHADGRKALPVGRPRCLEHVLGQLAGPS